ncbi:hypothetical protein BK121_00605 [Paenibacillus odorifer]|uniref:Bacterial bifunctional deaminase-reductase C-terminal domain-containing protein n=2 Tax=Paenibacillus odorifer TaxID=189426 RepID=A0ABX3H2I3_9BACL|nr:RibD family protein [Paenibacillus odorifer]OMC74573.1 hypothetical protein BK121_00605 [Paenibacillus odorifer]OMD40964.1 hypothetical protein BSO21_00510 [Paenibacillus odorifer]OME04464.1 hypothetical protein BSK54_03500 [Paenibacillus odorifer]
MDRPYIICHMLTSLDGKIIGDYLDEERTAYFIDEYENIHDRYGCKAWICGRITMEENFTLGNKLELEQSNLSSIPRTDYIVQKDASTYAVAVDPTGKLGWTKNYISEGSHNRTEDHIIEVLTEQVSDAYLAYLKNLGISYIFGGKERLNFSVVVGKLKQLFSIDKLMLEGGGILNGSFLNEDLIDELSLVIVPIADGASNSVTLFEMDASMKQQPPANFSLKSVEKLADDGLWLKYVTRRD